LFLREFSRLDIHDKTGKIFGVDRNIFVGSGLALQFLIAVTGAALATLLLHLLRYNHQTIIVTRIFIVSILLQSLSISTRSVFIALEKIAYESVLAVFSRLLLLGAAVCCIVFKEDLVTIVSYFVLVQFFFLVICGSTAVYNGIVPRLQLNRELLANIIKESWPYAISIVFVTIYFNIDSVMLSKMKGEEAVGFYNAAYLLVLALVFISTSVSNSVLPNIKRNLDGNPDIARAVFKRSLMFLGAVSITLTVILFVFARPVIHLVYGNEYAISAVILLIIVWVVPFIFLTNFFGRYLGIVNLQKKVVKTALILCAYDSGMFIIDFQ